MRLINLMRNILILASLCLASCATPGIPAFEKQTDTLIVLPRLFIDDGMKFSSNSFNLTLEVQVENTATGKMDRIVFTPLTTDYLFFQNSKPGKYVIKEMKLNKEKYPKPVMQYIEVSAGYMTIFPFKLVISTLDNSNYIYYYSYIFYELKKEDYTKIISVLSKDPNFKSWKVAE